MVAPSSSLQALALRLLAERVEAGGSISDGLAVPSRERSTLIRKTPKSWLPQRRWPGGKRRSWHLEVLEDRDAEVGGDSWDIVETRIRRDFTNRRHTA